MLDLHQILDLSQDGMCFRGSFQVGIGESLSFCLDLSRPSAYLQAVGRVVWCDSSGYTGIRFLEIRSADLGSLKQWLLAEEMTGLLEEETTMAATTFAVSRSKKLYETSTSGFPESAAPAKPGANPSVYASALAATSVVKRQLENIAADLDEVLKIAASRAQTLTRAHGAAIALLEGAVDKRDMLCRASAGSTAPAVGAHVRIGAGFSGECIRTGRLLYCEDSETDPGVDRESCRKIGVRSMIAVPVRSSESIIGLLEVFSGEPSAFGEGDKLILQQMAEIVLGCVYRAIQRTHLEAAPSARVAEPIVPSVPPAPDRGIEAIGEKAAKSENPRSNITGGLTRLVVIAGITVLLVSCWFILSPGNPGRAGKQIPETVRAANPAVPKPSPASAIPAVSFQDLQRLARQGDPAAQFALGVHYAVGSDVSQDYTEATRWFASAAERGHVMAQSTLGAYYWAGRGVPRDLNKAYYWALLAQAGGDEASRIRVPFLASRIERNELIAIQDQANQWLKDHLSANTAPQP